MLGLVGHVRSKSPFSNFLIFVVFNIEIIMAYQ